MMGAPGGGNDDDSGGSDGEGEKMQEGFMDIVAPVPVMYNVVPMPQAILFTQWAMPQVDPRFDVQRNLFSNPKCMFPKGKMQVQTEFPFYEPGSMVNGVVFM
jgi:hypothetical protein